MRDFQEFINKKIAVTFADKKELRAFLELCKENNMTWMMRAPAIEPLSDCIWFKKILTKSIRHEGVLFYSEPERYKRSGHEIIPAAEFLTQSTPTIEIFQSKQTVVCLKKQGNKVVAVGKAKCNPDDVFDFKIGSDLAYTRMNSDDWKRNNPESQKMVVAGKLALDGFMEGMQNVTDALNGIKTLKNGMRIKKQEVYEVGDVVLIKKEWKSSIIKHTTMNSMLGNTYEVMEAGTDIDIKEDGVNYKLKVRNEGTHWDECWFVCQSDIKGKVIS